MRKFSVVVLLTAISMVVIAQAPANGSKKNPMPGRGSNGEQLTQEQRVERTKKFMEMRYRKTGGMVVRPGSQNGSIVFVNAQKAAKHEWIQEVADTFIKETRFKILVEEGQFLFPNPKIAGSASVFVIDDPAMPPVLSAPESKWVMINVAGLKSGAGEKPAFFHARCMKELTRGFCLIAGTQDSNYPQALVGPILKPEDLDQHADWRLPVDVLGRFKKYSSAYGVTPLEETTYKAACREGWAAAPTNDVQKAIWDQIHEVPTEPMVIKPEKHPAK